MTSTVDTKSPDAGLGQIAAAGADERSRPAREAPASSRAVASEALDLHLGSAILSLAAVADSGVEHYRGSFHNPGMYLPLVTGSAGLAASLFGFGDRRPRRHPARDLAYAASAAIGVLGLAFHAYNVAKRPGGVSWLNLFYGAPVGAPFALALAGFFGRYAEIVRDLEEDERCDAGRELGAVVAAGLAGTVGEAALLHFRGAYHNPAMALPVTLPPLSAALLAAAALDPTPERRRNARFWLRATAALGFLGVGFHAFGVARNMGGWRNWSQNVLNGPPLPAPPSFTGLALAGLAALKLMEKPR